MPRYRRIAFGRHSLPLNGKRVNVVHGDVIECEEWELGGFISDYECLNPRPDPPEPVESRPLTLKHAGRGRYNVIQSATGRPINDKPLTEKEAKSLISEQSSIKTELVEQDKDEETSTAKDE